MSTLTSIAPTAVVQLRIRELLRRDRMRSFRPVRPVLNAKNSRLIEPTVLQRWLDLSA